MADLVVLVPSRGRPEQLREMLAAIRDTASDVRVMVGLDDDDPADYSGLIGMEVDATLYRGPRRSLSGWTNHLARQALDPPHPPRYLASLGDDHRPRTPGWDRKLIEAIEALPDGQGWAYGNDLYQGRALPTAWVVSAEVARKLGWVMLPSLAHMYVDNAVLELGMAADRIAYVPGAVIEHLHPAAGKARMDDSYRETNAPASYERDRAAFESWRDGGGLRADLARLAGVGAVA